jgi:uncharacterized membrane protein YdjX (TVP38/TMEM64 family)
MSLRYVTASHSGMLFATVIYIYIYNFSSEPPLDWLAALGIARSPGVGLGSISDLIWDVSPFFVDLIPSTFMFNTCVEV